MRPLDHSLESSPIKAQGAPDLAETALDSCKSPLMYYGSPGYSSGKFVISWHPFLNINAVLCWNAALAHRKAPCSPAEMLVLRLAPLFDYSALATCARLEFEFKFLSAISTLDAGDLVLFESSRNPPLLIAPSPFPLLHFTFFPILLSTLFKFICYCFRDFILYFNFCKILIILNTTLFWLF